MSVPSGCSYFFLLLEELDLEEEELELDGLEDEVAGTLLRETAAGGDGDGRLMVGGGEAGRLGVGVTGRCVAAGVAGVAGR